jgi:hypothetical protein
MITEQQLAELFEDQAGQAPAPDALLEGTLRKVRSRRHRIAWGASGVAVLGAGAVLAGLSLGGLSSPIAGPATTGTVPAGLEGQPISVDGEAGSCVYEYSPVLVAEKLDFAFDGTVVSVGGPVASKRPGDPDPLDYAGVTFRVNEWFKGGSADVITVDMVALAPGVTSAEGRGSPSVYAPGTRLLVSGTARRGDGDPTRHPVAWYGCGGFTRYYSDRVADSWRAATR